MRRLIVCLLVLVGLLVAADRVAALLASREVAGEAANAAPECRRPGVDIGGFPFLTQAIAGRYDDVTLTTSCGGSVPLRRLHIVLHGVHLGIGQVVHRDVSRIPVDVVTASATLPYAAIDRGAGGQRLTFGPGPGHTIMVTGTLTVAGRSFTAHGTGSVSISAGSLRVTVGTISTPLGDLNASSDFDVSLPLPSLPFHITGLQARAGRSGIVLSATAHDVVLRR